MNTQTEKELLQRIAAFSKPQDKIAARELIVSLTLFAASFSAMMYGIVHSYWLTLLALPVAGIMTTRLFTIQHDCGHGSYFSSTRVNNIVGVLLGVLTLTPYYYWRKNHSVHHAFSGNLDKRGVGDLDTYTVAEYKALPFFHRLRYRIYRSPLFLLTLGPLLLFGVKHRLPLDCEFHSFKLWANVTFTNIAILLCVGAMVMTFGWPAFFIAYVPMIWIGSAIGVALFYVQHQYEGAYWDHGSDWKYFNAGLHGSSYLEFPRIVSWLVNEINLHHIHHLNGHVPSYRLRECLRAVPELQAVPKMRFRDIPPCFKLALWDDVQKKLVSFA